MQLVFASNNLHKLEEVRAIMPIGIDVLSLRDIGFDQEIEETGDTLAENSEIKARAVADFISCHSFAIVGQIDGVFADDTGLEIDTLGGKPGVYTARWSGLSGTEHEIFAANRHKALEELKGKNERGCQFKTVITLIMKNGECVQVEGVVRGQMAQEERGVGGFGYDPIFIPEGYGKTFAELAPEVKNSISHRARAMARLVEKLKMYDY